MVRISKIGYVVIIVLGTSLVTLWVPAESMGQTMTFADVHRAWRARQDQVTTARFKWVAQELASPLDGENRGRIWPVP